MKRGTNRQCTKRCKTVETYKYQLLQHVRAQDKEVSGAFPYIVLSNLDDRCVCCKNYIYWRSHFPSVGISIMLEFGWQSDPLAKTVGPRVVVLCFMGTNSDWTILFYRTRCDVCSVLRCVRQSPHAYFPRRVSSWYKLLLQQHGVPLHFRIPCRARIESKACTQIVCHRRLWHGHITWTADMTVPRGFTALEWQRWSHLLS